MTLDEKITHLQQSSMGHAREESNAILDEYKESMEKLFQDHKDEARKQARTKVKAEEVHAKAMRNKAIAKSQIESKRKQGQVQLELKMKLFQEVMDLLASYMKTSDYEQQLVSYIKDALAFAGGEELTLYLNASDQEKRESLETLTGVHLKISDEDFIGGIRAVLKHKNILVDHSYKTALDNEYNDFVFLGGEQLG